MKQACTTRVRYVVKIAISTCKIGSLGLNVFFAACVVALMPCESAQSSPSTWGESGTTGSHGNSFFRPQGDIFRGATTRPQFAPPKGNFRQVPSAGNSIPPGSAANSGAAIRNIQTGKTRGAVRAIGGMGQQGASGIPKFGQIAQTVQAGAEIAGTVNQIRGRLGRFQQGGSGLQNVAGMVGGVAGINQGLGRLGQGGTPNLGGILGGLRGQTGNGMFGNGMGAGPFGQMIGQNGQVMQIAATFLGLLQSLFPNLFGGAGLFNPSNTGQSAQTAFGNLMGANASGGFINPSGTAQDAISFCDARQMFGDQAEQAGLVGKVPDDIDDYWDKSRHGKFEGTKDQWATVMMAVASEESTFGSNGIPTKETFTESNGTLSQGVFSMTAGEYGLTSSSVFDPKANSRAAALTMNRLLGSNNTIAGLGRYWGPVSRGEVNRNTVTSAAGLGNNC